MKTLLKTMVDDLLASAKDWYNGKERELHLGAANALVQAEAEIAKLQARVEALEARANAGDAFGKVRA